MSKFKPGDKVRVVKEYPENETFIAFDSAMEKHLGKIVTIEDIDIDGDYDVEENDFAWHENWLEPIEDKNPELKEIIQKLTPINNVQLAIFATNMKLTFYTTAAQDIETFAEINNIKGCKDINDYEAYYAIKKVIKANPSFEQPIVSYALNLLKNQ